MDGQSGPFPKGFVPGPQAERGSGQVPTDGAIGMALWAILTVALYKVASLAVGAAFAYMGYRLFLAGLLRSAGDLEAADGKRSLKLTGAAPGTFFALFGAAVVAATILQGFDVELPGGAQQAAGVLPPSPPMVSDEHGR